MVVHDIKCKTCDIGTLRANRRYRMSGVVVVIGYILLIPSALGILASALMLISTWRVSSMMKADTRLETVTGLRKAGLTETAINKILSGELADSERRKLAPRHRAAVEVAETALNSSRSENAPGVTLLGSFSIFFGIASFVGGLIGWLLVMKKNVLGCDYCAAIVPTS